jgi:hypothetical protein
MFDGGFVSFLKHFFCALLCDDERKFKSFFFYEKMKK